MESNWRFNVWDVGLYASQYELVARVLNWPAPGLIWLAKSGGSAVFDLLAVGTNQVPVFAQAVAATGHFPNNAGGWIVEPDQT